jgi:O-antigen ligase
MLAPALLVLAAVTDGGWILAVACGGALLVAWSLLDVRATIVVAVLLATLVDYNTGMLTLELSILCAWLAWTCLLLTWRSAWLGWVMPPPAMRRGIAVWLGACAFGIAVGLWRGNSLRNMGLEVGAAMWPVLGLLIIQVVRRRSLVYAGLAMFGIGLFHTAFGLTMLQVYHQRLGGIYFTTVTGMVVVGLWTAALLAPTARIRAGCLLGMIPMLAHLLFSFTRGYWLGCIAGLAVATALSWRNLGRAEPGLRARRLLLLPALLAIVLGTLGVSALFFGGGDLFAALGGRLGSSFSTKVSGETLSNVIRLAEYDRAIASAAESPVIGKGFGHVIVTRDLLTRAIQEQWFVHNYYILLWLKLGLVGLIAFGVLIASFVRAAWKAAAEDSPWLERTWAIAAMAVTVQVLVILATNYSLADVNTAFAFAMVWGVFWAVRADRRASV